MNKDAFYDVMRERFGSLSQSQVDGTNALLDEGDSHNVRLTHLAYILATAWHETAATMKPIAEYGKGKGQKYGKPLPKYNNQVAYGRGYVQLTWDYNYVKADDQLDLKGALLKDFNLALDPKIASKICFQGMKEGWFTGKRLYDYLNDTKTDYHNARKIINGLDCAEKIESYAKTFEKALTVAQYT